MRIFSVYIYSTVSRSKLTISFFLSLVMILQGLQVAAQTSGSYESISIAQGLSQGMVFDLLQDKAGFIWVATKNGLNSYDPDVWAAIWGPCKIITRLRKKLIVSLDLLTIV